MQHARRVHPRAIVRLPVRIRPARSEEWTDARLHDLSSGGAGVWAKFPVAVQSELQLRFSIPDGSAHEEVTVSGLVVRSATPPGDHPGFRHLLGIHFLDLRESDFDRIRVFVWNALYPDSA